MESEGHVKLSAIFGGFAKTEFLKDKLDADATLEFMAKSKSTYSEVMRFILQDKKARDFTVERFCYRGGVDDWIYLDAPGSLEKFAQKYIKYLGTEELFELL